MILNLLSFLFFIVLCHYLCDKNRVIANIPMKGIFTLQQDTIVTRRIMVYQVDSIRVWKVFLQKCVRAQTKPTQKLVYKDKKFHHVQGLVHTHKSRRAEMVTT